MGWLAIQPKNDIGLIALRKDRAKVQNISGLNCALFLRSATHYIKEKLIEDGIPFVLKDKQIYLPFIGCLLSNSGERDIAHVELISFLTQKLILTAIYEKWEKVTVSTAAEKLGVSKDMLFQATFTWRKRLALRLYVSIHCCQIMTTLPMG